MPKVTRLQRQNSNLGPDSRGCALNHLLALAAVRSTPGSFNLLFPSCREFLFCISPSTPVRLPSSLMAELGLEYRSPQAQGLGGSNLPWVLFLLLEWKLLEPPPLHLAFLPRQAPTLSPFSLSSSWTFQGQCPSPAPEGLRGSPALQESSRACPTWVPICVSEHPHQVRNETGLQPMCQQTKACLPRDSWYLCSPF